MIARMSRCRLAIVRFPARRLLRAGAAAVAAKKSASITTT
jgi:hypothetical protein